MRFAGELFNKYTGDSDVSEHGAAWQRNHQLMQQKPVVPGFNTEDLAPTPELPAGNPFNQNDKGRYIQQFPGSGISAAPTDIPSDWPSINRPAKAPANHKYDEHMKEIVPSIPARLRKA